MTYLRSIRSCWHRVRKLGSLEVYYQLSHLQWLDYLPCVAESFAQDKYWHPESRFFVYHEYWQIGTSKVILAAIPIPYSSPYGIFLSHFSLLKFWTLHNNWLRKCTMWQCHVPTSHALTYMYCTVRAVRLQSLKLEKLPVCVPHKSVDGLISLAMHTCGIPAMAWHLWPGHVLPSQVFSGVQCDADETTKEAAAGLDWQRRDGNVWRSSEERCLSVCLSICVSVCLSVWQAGLKATLLGAQSQWRLMSSWLKSG